MPHSFLPWTDLKPIPSTPPMRGGSGIVYHATWRRPGAPALLVAVKLLKAGLLPGSESFDGVAAKVEAEAAAMALAMEGDLSDSVAKLCGVARGAPSQEWLDAIGADVASVLATPTAGGGARELLGLVMRWEEGGSLADLLHTPERAWGANTAARLQLCAQLAVGLCNLHAKGIIHADIKSGNVLLSDRGPTPRPLFTDFGIAELRRAAATTTSHTAAAAPGTEKGTKPYMALEMIRTSAADPFPASRTTDVFALGTLLWEVLTGMRPWARETDVERVLALMRGEGLAMGSPPLPLDTPVAVKEMLVRCMGEREARPKAERIAEVLAAAVAEMAAGEYDVFLSHAWVGGRRAPLTIEVYERLRDAGLKVWVDTDMGANFEVSMREGVARSKCVVALMSQHYSKRPNCLKELRYAKEQQKVVVGCFTETGVGSVWWNTSELKEFIDPAVNNMPNFVPAAGVDWEVQGGVPAGEREKLTRTEDALPKLLKLVRGVIAHTSGFASSGAGQSLLNGGGAGAWLPSPVHTPNSMADFYSGHRLLQASSSELSAPFGQFLLATCADPAAACPSDPSAALLQALEGSAPLAAPLSQMCVYLAACLEGREAAPAPLAAPSAETAARVVRALASRMRASPPAAAAVDALASAWALLHSSDPALRSPSGLRAEAEAALAPYLNHAAVDVPAWARGVLAALGSLKDARDISLLRLQELLHASCRTDEGAAPDDSEYVAILLPRLRSCGHQVIVPAAELALRRHGTSSAHVTSVAAGLLEGLFTSPWPPTQTSTEDEALASQLSTDGVLRLLVAALLQHAEGSPVAALAVARLLRRCSGASQHTALAVAEAGAVPALVRALTAHPEDSKLTGTTSATLADIARAGDAQRREVLELKGCVAVVRALAQWRSSEDGNSVAVAEALSRCLEALLSGKSDIVRMIALNAANEAGAEAALMAAGAQGSAALSYFPTLAQRLVAQSECTLHVLMRLLSDAPAIRLRALKLKV